MAYWLFKSEPEVYPWERLVREGRTGWDGVRNHQAANHMKAMQLGDRGFFYHSGGAREIVGVVEVIGLYRPDPGDETGKFGLVDVRPLQPVKRAVGLAAIKAEPALRHLALVRQSRLSVSSVDAAAWRRMCEMAAIPEMAV
jgi:predicted RNA-binding protein with PUA-like domain